MSTRHFLHLALMAGALSMSCRADTVFLTDGTEINGTIIEENSTTIAVKRANGSIQSFRRADVDSIVYAKKKSEEVAEAKKEAPPAAATKPAEKKPEAAAAETKPTPEKTPANASETPKSGDNAEVKAAGSETKTVTGEAPKADPSKPAGKDDKEAAGKTDSQKETQGDKKEKDTWTAPLGLPAFPDHAKRMPKEKEEIFMGALERMASTDPNARGAARSTVAALGPDALPYVVAGIQHTNVEARSTCMALVGQLNGRTAVKQVIEVFYSAMPENDAAPSYQVPFIRAIKETLPGITGQSFIYVQPDKALVADGLKKYVAWYDENFDRLPPQLGEAKIEPTDPDYAKKLKDARKLKLEKKSWPRPPMPADQVTGSKTPPASASERPADRAFKDTIKTVKREDAGKR